MITKVTKKKSRQLIIAGEAWKTDPPASVVIRKIPPMASLLWCVLMLEEFYRRHMLKKMGGHPGRKPIGSASRWVLSIPASRTPDHN